LGYKWGEDKGEWIRDNGKKEEKKNLSLISENG
jgi:hypothetical protein